MGLCVRHQGFEVSCRGGMLQSLLCPCPRQHQQLHLFRSPQHQQLLRRCGERCGIFGMQHLQSTLSPWASVHPRVVITNTLGGDEMYFTPFFDV